MAPNITASPTPTEVLSMDNWRTYTNEEYGFELKYPNYWGNAKVNKIIVSMEEIVSMEDEIIKSSIDKKDLPKIARNEASIDFDGNFCIGSAECFSNITITEYNNETPLQLECYEGSCYTSNILDEKKEIEQNSNIIIGNLKGAFWDFDFVPAEAYQRFYEVVLPKYKFVFRADFYHSGFNIPSKFQSSKTRGRVFLEEISKANPDQKDFADFLGTIKKVVDTVKFTK